MDEFETPLFRNITSTIDALSKPKIPTDDEQCARLCATMYEALDNLLETPCASINVGKAFRALCIWRGHRVNASVTVAARASAPHLWTTLWFIVECQVRLWVVSMARDFGPTWTSEIEGEHPLAQSETLVVEHARIAPEIQRLRASDVIKHVWRAADTWDDATKRWDMELAMSVSVFACYEGVPSEDDNDEWSADGKPTLNGLRVCERTSTLAGASSTLAELLRKNLCFECDADDSAVVRVEEWVRAWGRTDIADGMRDLLIERLLRSPGGGCTALDFQCPNVVDSDERQGSEARMRPNAFALAVSRPDDAQDKIKRMRDLVRTVWDEDPTSSFFENVAISCLSYAVQQVCDVSLCGRYIFDDASPLEALGHLVELCKERSATRFVPRLFRSERSWYVVVPTPMGAEDLGTYTTYKTEKWQCAIVEWCRLAKQNAQGVLARGKIATSVLDQILSQPPAKRPTAAAVLATSI
jgi:hypothetical protein